jgi:hypothetical protein
MIHLAPPTPGAMEQKAGKFQGEGEGEPENENENENEDEDENDAPRPTPGPMEQKASKATKIRLSRRSLPLLLIRAGVPQKGLRPRRSGALLNVQV